MGRDVMRVRTLLEERLAEGQLAVGLETSFAAQHRKCKTKQKIKK